MDSFEFNKMAGALLGTLVVGMGLGFVADAVFDHPAAKPGWALPIPTATAQTANAAAPKEPPLPVLLAKGDAQRGENDTHVCQTCHNLAKGEGAKIGPPLYGVVDRAVASVAGFDYSDALKKKGGKWTFDNLFVWLKDPQAYAPGTKMAFAGEPDPQKRADILLYLRKLSDNPAPLPPVPAAASAKPAASASAGPPVAAAQAAGAAASGAAAIDALLPAASVTRGESDTRVCQICHNFGKGEGAKIGPPLYGVVGRKIASVPGFDYSASLKSKTGDWTYANLSQWIEKPEAFAPGTKMAYPGEPDIKKRADIIAYLRSLSEKPEPLPAASGSAPAPAKASAAAPIPREPTPAQQLPLSSAPLGAQTSPAAPSGSPSGSMK